jgi:hypothetical protein
LEQACQGGLADTDDSFDGDIHGLSRRIKCEVKDTIKGKRTERRE